MSMQTTVAPSEVPAGVGPRPALALDPKIQSRHLACGALIYVRQSHPSQVQRHPESARRQYGLVERARALGWPAEHITIIDEDQGKSAAGSAAAHERDGFARLVSAVGLGEVGIILALEVYRLARNSALCRCRHKADYAARRIMPTSTAEAPLEVASGTKESA